MFKHGVVVTLIMDPNAKPTLLPENNVPFAIASSDQGTPAAKSDEPSEEPSESSGEPQESASETAETPDEKLKDPKSLGKNARKKLRKRILGEVVTLAKYAQELRTRINPIRVQDGRVETGLVNRMGEVSWPGTFLDEEIASRKKQDEERAEASRGPAPVYNEPEHLAKQASLWRVAFEPSDLEPKTQKPQAKSITDYNEYRTRSRS